jgi:hypothetical protein
VGLEAKIRGGEGEVSNGAALFDFPDLEKQFKSQFTPGMSWLEEERTSEGPAMEISSRPSRPQTTQALRTPRSKSASAKIWPSDSCATPTTMALGLAGLTRGPKRLKMVGNPSSRRSGATWAREGW